MQNLRRGIRHGQSGAQADEIRSRRLQEFHLRSQALSDKVEQLHGVTAEREILSSS